MTVGQPSSAAPAAPRSEVAETPVASVAGVQSGPIALLRYASLTRELATTQFKLKYAGSVLGYIWSLAKPLMVFGIMYAVFARLLRVGANSPNFPIQLLFGVIAWQFFSETSTLGLQSIVGNANLIKKAFFPRSIIVISATLTSFANFAINMLLVVVIAGPLHHLDIGIRSLAMLPLVLELYVLTVGTALLLSSLYVLFRDVWYIWEIITQVLFYGSAVVYPLSFVAPAAQRLLALNPMVQIIEDIRHAIVAHQVPWTGTLLGTWAFIPVLVVIGIAVAGTLVFRRASPDFAEKL